MSDRAAPAPADRPGPRRWWAAAWPALLLAVALSAPWLSSPMFLDDWHVLFQADQADWTAEGLARGFTFLDRSSIETWNLPAQPAYHFFRPLVVASYKLDLALWGTAPLPSHLVNLLLHLASVALVALLALRLGGGRRVARIAAVLFAIQPQVCVAIVWTSGRTETLAGLWMLAGFTAYVLARQDRRPWWLAGTLAALGLAMLTKENAVLLPAMVGAYELSRWIAGGWPTRAQLGRAAAHATPVIACGVAYLGWRLLAWDPGAELGLPYYHDPLEAGFAIHALAKTAYNLVALVTTAVLVPLFGVELLVEHPLALAGLVAAAVGLYALILRGAGRRPLAVLGALWLGLALLPTLPILTVDLYLYFPSIGLAWLLATALGKGRPTEAGAADGGDGAWTRGRRWGTVALVGLFALGFCLRGGIYRTEGDVNERVFADVRADAPDGLEPGTRLLLVNMPIAASHIASTVRLRGGPDDVRATLISVSPEWTLPDEPAPVSCLGPHRVRVHPPGGRDAFFLTREEWNLQLLRHPLDPDLMYDADGVTITPLTDGDRVVALDLAFDEPLRDGPFRLYSFHDDGARLAHLECTAADGEVTERAGLGAPP